MKRLLVNIALFFVAIFLLSTIGVFGLIYGLYYSIRYYVKANFLNYWVDVIYSINVGIDQIGNVLLSSFLNRFCLINKQGHRFGKVTETISYVLAVNYFADNITTFGLWIVEVLEYLDDNHMAKSL
jgi:hypothetical protein